MDRFHGMTVFVAVADEESFAAGARRLRMSPPAVTRAVGALESRLGVRLLARTTRHVRTTEAGKRYLEDARRILGDLQAADEAAAGINAVPSGSLSVTAPVLFGRLFVLPGIVDYLERHPATRVSAVFLDRVVNLLEEGLDVGVRIGALPDSSLRAVRAGAVRTVVCGSPAYLRKRGVPRRPEALLDHPVVTAAGGSGRPGWQFEERGKTRSLRVRSRLTVTTNDSAIAAAEQGFGLTRVLSYQVAPQLQAGSLRVVLEKFEPPPSPIHVIHREGRLQSAKVRSFVDLMVSRLRSDATLQS